jgi:hypothetical protein
MSEHEQKRTSGPDFVDVSGKSEALGSIRETLTEIRMQAIDRARKLYGPDARLEVIRTSTVTALSGGRYTALVTVRCLDFPAEDL